MEPLVSSILAPKNLVPVVLLWLLWPAASTAQWLSTGSGFIVNSRGDVVTNAHVVVMDGKLCPVLSVSNAGKVSGAKVIAIDPNADLAVLKLDEASRLIDSRPMPPPPALPPPRPRREAEESRSEGGWTAFTGASAEADPPRVERYSDPAPQAERSRRGFAHLSTKPAVQGQKAVLIGFPKSSVLSSEPKVTDGIVVSTRGPSDDPRVFQHSIPSNPGNSGGPIFDDSGNVIGVLVSGIDSIQGANFGVTLGLLQGFLEGNGIPHEESPRGASIPTEELMAEAVHYTVFIRCGR